MTQYKNFSEMVGNTPLVKLRGASEISGAEIWGKCEFLNPGQSIKDRAALNMILDAEQSGDLVEGGIIVEGTAGNTGIGLALIGASRGYETVIVIPETQSQEKKDMIKMAGAQLVEVPAAPYSNPNNYVRYSERLAKALAKEKGKPVLWANQFDNTANREAHIKTTSSEIIRETGGDFDGFVASVGSGGTIAGVSIGLKDQNHRAKIALADPHGAALHSYYTTGEFASEGSSITEGIGQGRITKNLEGFSPDFSYLISDKEALQILFDLALNEGLSLGGSSGINIAGAIALGKELGKGSKIITMLCDYGSRYQSKLYNPSFLRQKGLPIPNWLERTTQFPNVFE